MNTVAYMATSGYMTYRVIIRQCFAALTPRTGNSYAANDRIQNIAPFPKIRRTAYLFDKKIYFSVCSESKAPLGRDLMLCAVCGLQQNRILSA